MEARWQLEAHRSDPYSARRVRRSLTHFVIGRGLSAVIGVAFLLLLVRALSAQAYGTYIVLLATLEIVQLASSVGLHGIAHRFVPELRAQGEGKALIRLLGLLCLLRVLTLCAFAAAIYPICPYLARLLGLGVFESVVAVYLLVIVFEGYARYVDILLDSLLLQHYSQFSILLRNGFRLAFLGAVVVDTAIPVDLATWIKFEVIAGLAGSLVGTVLLFRFAINERSLQPGSSRRLEMTRYFSYSCPAYVAQVVGLVYGIDSIKLIMSRSIGALQMGAFGFAAALASMLQRYLPMFLLIGLVRPLFVSARQRSDYGARLAGLAAIVFKLNAFAVVPIIALLLVAGNDITGVLSAGRFADASGYLVLLSVLLLFQSLHSTLLMVAMAMEDGQAGMQGTFLALIGLGVGLGLFQLLGGYGLCLGLLLSEWIWCARVASRLVGHGVTLRVDGNGFARILIAAVGCSVAALVVSEVLRADVYTTLSLSVLAGATAYLGVAWWLKPFSAAEREIINRVLPRPFFVW